MRDSAISFGHLLGKPIASQQHFYLENQNTLSRFSPIFSQDCFLIIKIKLGRFFLCQVGFCHQGWRILFQLVLPSPFSRTTRSNREAFSSSPPSPLRPCALLCLLYAGRLSGTGGPSPPLFNAPFHSGQIVLAEILGKPKKN